MNVRTVSIGKVALDPANVRTHDERNLKAIQDSLRVFGQRKPIVVMKADDGYVVIAGNGTLEAARAIGWDEIAVAVVPEDWTSDEAAAYAIADNRTAELASWDEAGLNMQLAELEAAGWEPELLGFDGKGGLGADEVVEDEVPEPPADPVTKPGDLWLLGEHRLLCGDSFDDDDRSRLLRGVSVSMVATDPPYAIYGSSTGVGSDVADDKMVRPFFENLGRIVFGVLPKFGHAYICCDWRSWAAVWYGMRRSGLAPKNMLVWDKGGGGMGSMYQQGHELIGFFAKLGSTGTMTSGNETGQRTVLGKSNVLRHSRVSSNDRDHNAQKPVEIMAELVVNSSDEGDTVLDLFGGSGSTLIACEQTNRRCAIMEMEPAYCDVIVQRWENLTGVKATLADG